MSDVKTDEINFDDIELDEGFDEFDTDELDLDLNIDDSLDDSLDDSINDSDSDLADITFDDEQFSTEEKDNQDDILEDEQESQDRLEDYTDGTVVEDIDLHEDEEEMVPTTDSDFINDSGSIVVQDSNDANTPEGIASDLITGIAQLTSLQTEIFNEADEQGDYVTADLMTQLSKWCEFNSWFLSSINGGENKTNV